MKFPIQHIKKQNAENLRAFFFFLNKKDKIKNAVALRCIPFRIQCFPTQSTTPSTQVYHIENKLLGTGRIFQTRFWLTSPGYKYTDIRLELWLS